MKYVEVIGFKRANLGKVEAKQLRREAKVPCVLYGGENQVHFHAPAILFRPLVYTNDAHFVSLNIEGEKYKAILQDIQFHPVSENILHADFLLLQEGKPIKMNIPVHLEGNAIGVTNGGTLMFKKHSLSLKALPKNMPEFIAVDVTELDFHKSFKVSDLDLKDVTILDAPQSSIAVIEIPRALRGKDGEEEEDGEESEEAEETATE